MRVDQVQIAQQQIQRGDGHGDGEHHAGGKQRVQQFVEFELVSGNDEAHHQGQHHNATIVPMETIRELTSSDQKMFEVNTVL